MPVKKDEQGRRYVEAEVEVPGAPEEVWRAIATAEGISSWFVPTTSDEREGGTVVSSFGPGMDAVARITSWDPPHRYTAESDAGSEDASEAGSGAGSEAATDAAPDASGPGTVATEWVVEARAGGTCVVRVVHRWFADSDDWDAEFEGHAYGWAASFFRILRVYLTHFAGQPCAAFDLAAFSQAPPSETWRTFRSALEIDDEARRATSAPGAPELAGAVQSLEVTDPELRSVRERSPQIVAALEGMGDEEPELLLRLDRPAPGVAHAFVMAMGEQTLLSIRFFLYGAAGAAAATDARREWSAWLDERFGDGTSEEGSHES